MEIAGNVAIICYFIYEQVQNALYIISKQLQRMKACFEVVT